MKYSVAITPKQKIISFEDRLKVIEPLIEKKEALNTNIEKQQDELAALEPLVGQLDPNNPNDAEYINAFNQYKSDLTNFSSSIAGKTYEAGFKQQARDLKNTYLSRIKPISDAVAASQKAKDTAAKEVANGYLLGKQNAFNTPISAYMNGNDPRQNFYAVKTSDITKQGEDLASSISQRMYEEAGSDLDAEGYKAYVAGVLASDNPVADILKNPKFADALNKAREQFGFSNLDTVEKEKAEAALLTGFISGLQGKLSYQKQRSDYDPRDTWVSAETTGNDGRKYYEVRNGKGQIVGYTDIENNKHITPKQYNSLKSPDDPKLIGKQEKLDKQAREDKLKKLSVITDLGDVRYYGRIENNTRRTGEFTSQFAKRYGIDLDEIKSTSAKNEALLEGIAKALLINMGEDNNWKKVNTGNSVHVIFGDMLQRVKLNPKMMNNFRSSSPNSVILNLGGGSTDDYHFAAVPIDLLEYYIDQTNFDESTKTKVKEAMRKQANVDEITPTEEVNYEEVTAALQGK